jgi:hypothetical protein
LLKKIYDSPDFNIAATVVEAGYGTMREVTAMPIAERLACYFRTVVRQGASVDWRSGEVSWPKRRRD